MLRTDDIAGAERLYFYTYSIATCYYVKPTRSLRITAYHVLWLQPMTAGQICEVTIRFKVHRFLRYRKLRLRVLNIRSCV